MSETKYPIRTYSINHKEAGFLEFSIPVSNIQDVEAYLRRRTTNLPLTERIKLQDDLLAIAKQLWEGFACWVGDPVQARIELRQDPEIEAWLATEYLTEPEEEHGELINLV